MSEFDQLGSELHQARSDKTAATQKLFESQEKVKQLQAQQEQLQRTIDPQNPNDEQQMAVLQHRLESAKGAAVKAQFEHDRLAQLEQSIFNRFGELTDPRKQLTNLDDQYPILLMPLRIETRWRVQERQLWVRVYPDDAAVDSFEPTLSEVEVASGQRFWASMWAAGGVEAQQRAAWRGLVASHGVGRAAWIKQQYLPLSPALPPKADPEDQILVIPTTNPPSAADAALLVTYWKAVWLADGNVPALNAARSALVTAVGEAHAAELIEQYTPQNIDDKPATKAKNMVVLSAEFLTFPAPDDTATKRNSWSQPARTNVMPDRLVLLGYQGGTTTPIINELGNPIPSPLILTPDPSAASADQVHLEDGDLVVSEDMKWVVDFDRAVSIGMGFKINLSQWNDIQWTRGFSRLVVVGVRLSGGAQAGKQLLETLISDHHYSAKGFSLLPQGSPTNNTDASGASYSRAEDPDDTFDNYVQDKVFFSPETDPLLKKDGQWLAEALGISYESLSHIPNTDQTDQAEAFAMNSALYPATFGYMLRTMLKPGISWDQVDDVRWFFRNFVSGRGQVPATRIGSQPYGILPTTAYSRMTWFNGDRLPFVPDQIESPRPFFRKLYDILNKLSPYWQTALGSVAHVDAEHYDDAHKALLDILGLHPSSVDYYSRVAQSENHLYNVMNLQGQATQFMTAYRALIFGDRGTDIATADQTLALLHTLGYDFDANPDILKLIFNRYAQKLKGAVIDDRPLSETALIRDYAVPLPPDTKNRNYLQWLVDSAKVSFETLRTEAGFIDNKPPTALLYLVLRFAMMQSYWKTTIEFHRSVATAAAFDVEAVRSEPMFINVKQNTEVSESRFTHMYTPLAGVTNPNEMLVAAIPRLLGNTWQTIHLDETIAAAESLVNVPTARLERLFAEHIDLCSYRLDAWQQGLVRFQLTAMRTAHYNPQNETPGGVYIGAYGWLENIKPEGKVLTPVQLPEDLAAIFNPPVDGAPAPTPIMHDPTNEGYIHAPSLNHAVTAAMLRNGYNATADPTVRESMAVNLSSERVRLALSFIEGIRNGQSLSALLGYQLERALHDGSSFAEVDTFIYALRKQFPLQAGKIKLPINPVTGAVDPDLAPIEAQEARNVVDGVALLNFIKQNNNPIYPFGNTKLPPTQNAAQATVINDAVQRLLDIHDALADLAMAEGVHQIVQGNYDRAGATMDAYSRGNFPPIPDVIQTPRTGITLTHRVGLHFEPGLSFNTSPVGGISMTPRASGEPAVNKWISSVLPNTPSDILCKVIVTDPVTAAETRLQIAWADLQVQPIDLLYLVQPENQQAMAELDDRIMRHIVATLNPRPDAKIDIHYAEPIPTKYSFFEIAPMMQSLRALLLASRPLQRTDIMLTTEAKTSQDDPITANRPRLEHVRDLLNTLHTDLANYVTPLQAIFDDLDNQRTQLFATVDTLIDNFNGLLTRASSFGLPQTGWGFTYGWKATTFGGLIDQIKALIDRWTTRLNDFDTAMTAYAALPGTTTDDERFEALQRAELIISTALTDPRPTTPTDLEAALAVKRNDFANKLGQFATLLTTNTTSVTILLNSTEALLPIDAFDSSTIDIAAIENQIVTFCGDLLRVSTGVRDDAQKRLDATQVAFDAHTAASTGKAQVEALQQAATALFGEDFRIIPEFTLLADHGSEWEKAYSAGTNGELLKFQTDPLPAGRNVDFPVDDWLYGVARVRDKLHHWERITMLSGAFTDDEPELTPIQLPYRNDDRWLALEYPDDPAFVVDSERLLYTAHYPLGFSKTSAQCGILLDEWTEILPTGQETTGLTFHYDRPSTEPPQVMLLVTPPQFIGAWQWDDLVAALNETLALAKQRAVEPSQLENTPLNRLLPATLMALTLREVSISGNLAINNLALDSVRRIVQ